MELCISNPKTKGLVLLIYASEFYDVILLFLSLKRYRNSNHCKIFIFKLRLWLNDNAMFCETFTCCHISEAKPLCFSLCSQMFDYADDVEYTTLRMIVTQRSNYLFCYFFSVNVL